MENGKIVAKENVVLSLSHFPPTEVLKSHGKRKSCFVNTPFSFHGMVKENIVFSISQFPTTKVLKSHGNDALASHPNDISRKSYVGPPSFTHPSFTHPNS